MTTKDDPKKPTDKEASDKEKEKGKEKELSAEELARVTGGAGGVAYYAARRVGAPGEAAPPAGEAAPPAGEAAPPAKPG